MVWKGFALMALVAISIASPVPEVFEKIEGRIVGGTQVTATTQFPHQVSLRTVANFHFCGGSIISNRWVLSAAHCTIGRGQGTVRVTVGTINLNTGGIHHTSVRIINHPEYDPNTLANDVSVLQTQNTITLNAGARAIALGSAQHGVTIATLTGWGSTNQNGGGAAPNRLQRLETRTMTNLDCRSRHTEQNAALVFDHKICTFTQIGQGACQGDSGGALIAENTQIGIFSWSLPCGVGWPDVHDRVSHFRAWILETIAT